MVVDRGVALYFAPHVAKAYREVDVEVARYGQGVGVGYSGGVVVFGRHHAFVVYSPLQVEICERCVKADVMSGKWVVGAKRAYAPFHIEVASIDAVVVVAAVVPPCIHPVGSYRQSVGDGEFYTDIGYQQCVVEHVGIYGSGGKVVYKVFTITWLRLIPGE